MKTYRKHLHDPTRILTPPDLMTQCRKCVPPSEITTDPRLVTCEACRALVEESRD